MTWLVKRALPSRTTKSEDFFFKHLLFFFDLSELEKEMVKTAQMKIDHACTKSTQQR